MAKPSVCGLKSLKPQEAFVVKIDNSTNLTDILICF